MDSFSLFDLNEYIRRVIALNFSETFWVHAEISQISEVRGQYYINLIEKSPDTDDVISQSSAVIWYKTTLFLKNKLGDLLPSILQEGTEVKLKVQVEYHERFGLKLVVEDVDVTYTIGQLEINRQKIIERLKKEPYYTNNKSLNLPFVAQRIAVISSKTAAGYQDFIEQLRHNPYGYAFMTHLFDSAMQGRNVSTQVCNAMRSIEELAGNYDVIVIIRGGGSKIDLSGFDDYNIGAAIAKASIPVLTGIGHDIDNTIADLVSHTSIKTPTAVANFIIDHNAQYEGEVRYIAESIQGLVQHALQVENRKLQELQNQLTIIPQSIIAAERNTLHTIEQLLSNASQTTIQQAKNQLAFSEQLIDALSIEKVLSRGYSYVSRNDKIITSGAKLKANDKIDIHMQDAVIQTTINNIKS